MALGKELGNFSFKITTTSFSDERGAVVDCDGTADNFGMVLGTLTFHGGDPNEANGWLSWRGQAFLETGQALSSVGEGSYEALDNHKWRTRLIITISDGRIFASDGLLDLEQRSISGKNLEWS